MRRYVKNKNSDGEILLNIRNKTIDRYKKKNTQNKYKISSYDLVNQSKKSVGPPIQHYSQGFSKKLPMAPKSPNFAD